MSDKNNTDQLVLTTESEVKSKDSVLVLFGKNIANLFKVKTILTLLLAGVFCFLSVRQLPIPAEFMSLFTMVVGFYFGTQSSK